MGINKIVMRTGDSMINWKIDIADLINIILLIIGAIVAYFLLDRFQKEDSRFAVIETLAENVKSISPGLDVHYTNQLSDDGKKLEFRVYIKNVSNHDVWVGPSELYYLSGNDKRTHIRTDDVFGFNNMLAPQVDLCIEFNKDVSIEATKKVSISFNAETIAAYSNTLLLAVSELSDNELKKKIKSSIDSNIVKRYGYEEEIYRNGKNEIWKTFCESPR